MVISSSVSSGQAPLTVSFTNTSKNANEFQWDFGDGATMTTSTVEDPVTHEYTKVGTHTVTLVAVKRGDPPETSTITLTVVVSHGSLDHVKLNPETVELAVNHNRQFTIEAFDAFKNPIPEAQVTWEVVEEAGTISSNGLFTAGANTNIFPDAILASARLNSYSAKATDSVTVRTPIIISSNTLSYSEDLDKYKVAWHLAPRIQLTTSKPAGWTAIEPVYHTNSPLYGLLEFKEGTVVPVVVEDLLEENRYIAYIDAN